MRNPLHPERLQHIRVSLGKDIRLLFSAGIQLTGETDADTCIAELLEVILQERSDVRRNVRFCGLRRLRRLVLSSVLQLIRTERPVAIGAVARLEVTEVTARHI